MNNTIEVWLTKLCLTEGIRKCEAVFPYSSQLGWVRVMEGGSASYYQAGEWHRTESKAREVANRMLDSRMLELEAELARLRALTF